MKPGFWVVRIGAGGPLYGPFPTERRAEEFAWAPGRGLRTSNFIIPVLPVPGAQPSLFGGAA